MGEEPWVEEEGRGKEKGKRQREGESEKGRGTGGREKEMEMQRKKEKDGGVEKTETKRGGGKVKGREGKVEEGVWIKPPKEDRESIWFIPYASSFSNNQKYDRNALSKKIDGRMGGWTNRQTDGQRDGRVNRQMKSNCDGVSQ